MSHHYANDGQFNFSRSEGEFLIRVRQSSQDGEREGELEREGGGGFDGMVRKGGEERAMRAHLHYILFHFSWIASLVGSASLFLHR